MERRDQTTLQLRQKIAHILSDPDAFMGKTVHVAGWVRTARAQKTFTFAEINDGSCLKSMQLIVDHTVDGYQDLATGTSVMVTGTVVESPGDGQSCEIKAESLKIFGTAPGDTYPLQKKRHSQEFLRTIAHLRPRTNLHGAVARVRSCLAFATHEYFQDQGFLFLQSPIITASDCEGAGQMFKVTTLNLEKLPKNDQNTTDYTQDFFGKPTYLTVSGQLNAESYACALSDVYTFGPTFRAENSHTGRHVAEFWMVEPEMAFADLSDVIRLAEGYVKHLIEKVLERCPNDIDFFAKFVENTARERLEHILKTPFTHLTYTDAMDILIQSNKKFDYKPEWGIDLQTEHERYIAEEHCQSPVFITDYPRDIKAFYMRDNDDGRTVAAMDLILPQIGELIGGSQREERLPILERKLNEHNLDPEIYRWYTDLRRFGTVPHGGFGLGFERMVQFVTGVDNIREVSPFPRVPGHADY